MVDGQSKAHEQQFNYELGNALKGTTAQWKASSEGSFSVERTGELKGSASKRVDILVRVDGLPVVAIETSYDGRDACNDAMARISEETVRGGKMITTAIAVEIPLGFRHFTRDETARELRVCDDLKYAMYQYLPAENDLVRLPECGFFKGSVFNLSHLLNSAVVAKEVVDDESGKVALLVRNAAERLEEGLTGDQQAKLSGVVYQRTPFKGLQTTAVLWLNALLTMQRLQKQGVVDTSVFSSLGIGSSCDPRPVLDAWQKIWEKNWRSIFGPAITALEWSMRWDFVATADALGLLVNAVQSIELMQLGSHVHIGAELFPKLSEDRKETAAFYTQPATAELLATLTIRSEDMPYKGADLFEKFRLGDLACGTGTLLRAGYQQIKAFHEENGGDIESVKCLHKTAMEKGLIGVDISPIATHFASSSLAAIGMGEPYGKTQIGWVEVGGKEGLTGALEYFHADGLSDLFVKKFGQSEGSEEDEGTAMQSVVVSEGSLDVLMMNPPYTNTQGRPAFDIKGLSQDQISKCQERWKKQMRGVPALRTAGMAASFLALARLKVKRGGRIGFVLPLTAAFGDSWTKTRAMLECDFEDITAVVVSSGKALGTDALSADTNMEEMLLTATRRELKDIHNGPSSIRCVTLEKPPIRLGEAREIGRAILKVEDAVWLGDGKVGSVVDFEASGDGMAWSPLGVVHSDLAIVAYKLRRGMLCPFGKESVSLGVDMATVDDVLDVGPVEVQIGHVKGGRPYGVFAFSPVISRSDAIGENCAMWSANSKTQRQLVVLPTHKGIPTGMEDQCKQVRRSASTLFYATGIRWTSQAMLSVTTHIPAMGGRAWVGLGHVDSRVLKASVLWFNSIFGMLIHWTQGMRTQPGRCVIRMGAIRKMPCPCFADLSVNALDFAVCAFDSLKERVLLPACQVHVDVVRDEIDQAVIDMLDLPKDTIKDIRILRRFWCEEPSVHGGNKTALKLLKERE